jgi:hypothetical protein
VDADDLIDRNRRLLARADAARGWKRLTVEEIAENLLRLYATLLRTASALRQDQGRVGDDLSAQSIAHQMITHPRP